MLVLVLALLGAFSAMRRGGVATAVVLAKMGRASGAARSREVALRLDEATGVRPPGAPGFIGSARFRETWGEYVGTEG